MNVEVLNIQVDGGNYTAVKANGVRVVALSLLPLEKWTDGLPAIAILPDGSFQKARVCLENAGFTFRGWPDDIPWTEEEDVGFYKEILLVAMTCFPSDTVAAPKA